MLRTRIRAGTVAGVVISLVLAAALSAVQSFELFIDGWTPAFGETTAVTLRVPYGPRIVRNQYSGGSNISYEHTRIIIPAGTLLSEQNQDHRAAVAYESNRRPPRSTRIIAYGVIDELYVAPEQRVRIW